MSELEDLHRALSCFNEDSYKNNMKSVLVKLGLMPEPGVLKIEDLQAVLSQATANFGTARGMMISPKALADLKKQNK